MVDVIIGNKKNNVFNILGRSMLARVTLLIVIVVFHNQVFNLKQDIHLEGIAVSVAMGISLLNLVVIPFRLLADKKIARENKLMFVVISDLVAIYFLNCTEEITAGSIIKNIGLGIIISLVLTGIVVGLNKHLKVHSQRRRFRNNDFDHMDGWEFEHWAGQWLQKHGYTNVKVTSGSGDYGADVLAIGPDGYRYAVQCKKYTGKVPYRAVEEVIAAKEYYHCDKAMVFTNSELTAQASEAARKLGIVVIDGTVI